MAINFLNTVAVDESVLFVDTVNDRVGIGTTSPENKLDILNNYAYETSTTVHNNAHIRLSEDTQDNFIANLNGGLYLSSSIQKGGSRVFLGDGATKSATIKAIGGSLGFVQFMTGSGTTDTIVSETAKMTIANSGNVGIGTTSPNYKFVVSNGTQTGTFNPNSSGFMWLGSTSNHPLYFGVNDQTKMALLSNGNVGIGVTSPGEKLSVNGNLRIFGTDTNAIQFENSVSGTRFHYIIPHYNASYSNLNSLEFQISSATPGSELSVMTLNGAGNVGIGTTSPSEKLEVNGNIKIQSALLSNQNNTDVDTGTEAIASVVLATYTAAFFDFVIKKGTNVRSGTVYACHDGTNVEFTETSTNDLGDTSDVTLNVVISTIYLQLQATTTSDDWSVKSLIRAI